MDFHFKPQPDGLNRLTVKVPDTKDPVRLKVTIVPKS